MDEKNNCKKLLVVVLYRCAGNWKKSYEVEVDIDQYPEIKSLNVGDDIEMGDFGTYSEEEFFGDVFPYKYDFELDHNILEVTEISPMSEGLVVT